MTPTPREIGVKVLDTFSEIAASIGYSPVHGRIIGALLAAGKPLSLSEIAKATGYSNGMVSLSMDLLEVLGLIRKIKKQGDRQLYIELNGDLLECLKKAFVMKLEKSIANSLRELGSERAGLEKLPAGPEKEVVLRTLAVLEKEIKRLDKYTKLLAGIRLP